MTARILVVDDEQPLVEAIAYNLRKEGFVVLEAFDGEAALRFVERERPDLIVLDLLLPRLSGLDVCRIIRRSSSIPIIMLTAKAEETDRVVGLELGADDYVTKPFSMRELIARVKAVLRRTQERSDEAEPMVLEDDGLRVDVKRHEVRLRGHLLDLAPKEFDLLVFLMSHAGHVFSRVELLERVWGTLYADPRTVDVHIHWLRQKVEENPSRPRRLLTVRGVGYKYRG